MQRPQTVTVLCCFVKSKGFGSQRLRRRVVGNEIRGSEGFITVPRRPLYQILDFTLSEGETFKVEGRIVT